MTSNREASKHSESFETLRGAASNPEKFAWISGYFDNAFSQHVRGITGLSIKGFLNTIKIPLGLEHIPLSQEEIVEWNTFLKRKSEEIVKVSRYKYTLNIESLLRFLTMLQALGWINEDFKMRFAPDHKVQKVTQEKVSETLAGKKKED